MKSNDFDGLTFSNGAAGCGYNLARREDTSHYEYIPFVSKTTKTDMPYAVYFHAYTDLNNKGYSLCGKDDYDDYATTGYVFEYLPDTWVSKTDYSHNLSQMGATIVNNKVYALGGYEVYDDEFGYMQYASVSWVNYLENDTWTTDEQMPDSVNHMGAFNNVS